MKATERSSTLGVYQEQALALAEYYNTIAPREGDIDRAFKACAKNSPRVVELGCGNGRDAALVLERTERYLGVDISTAMVELAQTANPNGCFQVGDIRDFPLPAEVDIVFAFASLLHSTPAELKLLLEKVHSNLSEQGVFYISLKRGQHQKILKEDNFGRRWFYLYQPADILQLAGELYQSEYVGTDSRAGTAWFTLMLRKR